MQKKSFEELMKQLETVVSSLESGDTELDKALGMYKEGVDTIKQLNKRLNEARKQIEVAGGEENRDE